MNEGVLKAFSGAHLTVKGALGAASSKCLLRLKKGCYMSGINMYKVFVKNRMCKMIFEKVVKSRVDKKIPAGDKPRRDKI